ncbi:MULTISPECIES: bifunctional [glutamate--ammonia ligase]-adenylyl-L-tyrosine phosphorylase/[glutamate--ammonia-ligase] adenylyltransferase [Thiorhodovibrio]|uniref:bifunctional [glutamate--ammonia ligase]-adenylyl-L-tyrosine phosphorylase/[glutamate--ammonia-ligase] adenylyltransferase n=1 Tax=Thiorhodovibrio TaxID=61593 RepID=UPI001911EDC0|nr:MULTISPECIES: bifunctional [glutamate--ammonia ligase]-adenylyl-L-tyrosine phosphorylase/[glutamate--ammonia-ligase] adenylyltransferase [Thiorhodovibrio]MBK5968978.1 bifunctional glutamine synthetase adenylyltransferase/deadenyltransferase [Thiorhodovibrio winogradskyi]WPL10306.1 Glutamate-ammonia-ligase adenylyltransferase [Thiorhodovibrio litoralis]
MNPTQTPEPTSPNESHWQDWVAWAAEAGIAVPEDAEFRHARARVWAGSEYVALSAARHPQLFADLLTSGALARVDGAASMSSALQETLDEVADEETLGRTLRQFRRAQMLRIIWRDLSGWASLEETLADLSALGDACVRETLALLEPWLHAELGEPIGEDGTPQRLIVLGMGKLGAAELNLSSDIDLIFAYPSRGETQGGPRTLTNEQFFTRLCQRLVKLLDAQTPEGFVFRVDTRLRPFGDAGPLAMHFDALETYYESQAREWERYAMIKARVIAGPDTAGAELMDMLRPFVYRRYLDFGAIDSLRHLKGLIDQEVRRKGMADNIKLGPGGIREIEFIGQSFQLVRGGREPDLQCRPILLVLQRLVAKGLLDAEVVADLTAAYHFLRLTENRLQAWADRQTHSLPTREPDRERLAHSLDFADWPSFLARLNQHRERVQQHFDGIFADPDRGEPTLNHGLGTLWTDAPEPAVAAALLAEAGFSEPDAAWKRLEDFRHSVQRKGLGQIALQRLKSLMPRLLEQIGDCSEQNGRQTDAPDSGPSASGDPPTGDSASTGAAADNPDSDEGISRDLTLERLLHVLDAILGRTAYLSLLVERPDALSLLVRLCAMSPWFSEHTARTPLLLDELLDARRLFAPLHRAGLDAELDSLLGPLANEDLEQPMERLRQFALGNQLRVAAADITGAIPLMVVSDYLTEIAEAAVSRSLHLAWDGLRQRHGIPAGRDSRRNGFLVLGYGKLGGIELGYHSDLDLVFLYNGEDATEATDGERPLSTAQFYIRLGQRLIHIMTTPTYSGVLYEIDMRLRPDGQKGMIARSLESFTAYQREEAWTWEHQALVRARPVAGDPQLAERFAEVRREILRLPREPDKVRTEVRDMRAKMRANLDKSNARQFDLKQGRGGIADIEFMVQYAVLRWAAQYPELTDWTDNIRLLETLAQLDLLPGDAAEVLTQAYKSLRAAYHRNALRDAPGRVSQDQLVAVREQVSQLWDSLMDNA